MSLAEDRGGVSARATSYGNQITFTSEERPALAVDGDLETAWRTGAFADARGERIELSYDEPVTTDHVNLTQVTNGSRNRFITAVRLRFDGGDPVDTVLSGQSRDAPGEEVDFPERTFSTLSVEILDDNVGLRAPLRRPVQPRLRGDRGGRPARRPRGRHPGADRPARRRGPERRRPPTGHQPHPPAPGPHRHHAPG